MGRAPELFVAAEAEVVLGVAAVAWVPGGFPVLVRMADHAKRRGLGRALMEAAATSAAGESGLLRGWGPVAEDGEAARFLAALGFAVSKRLLVFETDAARFAATMGALLARLAARVPKGALLPLADAPGAAVVQLVTPQLGVSQAELTRRIQAGIYDPALSLAVMVDGTLAGAMLCTRAGPVLEVEVNVIAPGRRHGWVNACMLEAMARRGRAAGIELFRFSCEAHVHDTVNLARRSGAQERTTLVSMVRQLT